MAMDENRRIGWPEWRDPVPAQLHRGYLRHLQVPAGQRQGPGDHRLPDRAVVSGTQGPLHPPLPVAGARARRARRRRPRRHARPSAGAHRRRDGGAARTHARHPGGHRPGQRAVAYSAGQYVEQSVPGLSGPRSYSFATGAADRPEDEFAFFVRRTPGGEFTEWLFADDRTGTRLGVVGPFGNLGLRPSAVPVLCVAGGSGLGPHQVDPGGHPRRRRPARGSCSSSGPAAHATCIA